MQILKRTGRVYGPFFFNNLTVKYPEYLYKLKNELLPRFEEPDYVFMQDGAPPHFSLVVREYLNEQLTDRWIGRATAADSAVILWPPRSPDLTPLDFFLWGFVKGKVYKPPLPKTIQELKQRITLAVALVTPEMLQKVWENMTRRLKKTIEVKGRHFENLKF